MIEHKVLGKLPDCRRVSKYILPEFEFHLLEAGRNVSANNHVPTLNQIITGDSP